jgi:DNA adenine methylase/adenine-specific DNA-methyltransferase
MQRTLFEREPLPEQVKLYPQLRYMGSKARLLPWIHSVLSNLEFSSALDAFSGSGCVGYLLKSLGKRVIANDFLDLAYQIALGAIANRKYRLTDRYLATLLADNSGRDDFIERTFSGVFFAPADLRFLDSLWANLPQLPTQYHRALAIAAMVRACVKRQPRGVFTVAGDPDHYKDGRRDLRLSLCEHFVESVRLYNGVVFDNGQENRATRSDILTLEAGPVDLVYMDPPYVPRADDNCYVKRYHFLEGLASYWRGEGTEILQSTKVKKIPKRYTPFSYRHTALEAFEQLFARFRESILALSYSSNGFPDLDVLRRLLGKYKSRVRVFQRDHRYHFGTHEQVSEERASVREFLLVGE